MRLRIARTSIPAIAAAALLGTGCEMADSPADTSTSPATLGRPLTTTVRVTGGGRVDPAIIDKTTFGFTVDGRNSPSVRGQLQTVFHFMILKAHSVMFEYLEPHPSEPSCLRFGGMARASDGHTGHRFRAVACDNGEPGSSPGRGPDKFGICVEDHRSTDTAQNITDRKCDRDPQPTELTGGNIQFH
jgi:hypothetical protein